MTWYHVHPDGTYHEVDERGIGPVMQPMEERRVALDAVAPGIEVSTIFLGLDYGFDGGPPVLWETLVMGGDPSINQYERRYTSKADAVAGHAETIAWVKGQLEHGPLSDEGLGRVAYEAARANAVIPVPWEVISEVRRARYRRIGRAVADHVRAICE